MGLGTKKVIFGEEAKQLNVYSSTRVSGRSRAALLEACGDWLTTDVQGIWY